MSDTRFKLTTSTVFLHWILTLGIIIMLPYGSYIEGLEDGPNKWQAIGMHKSIGIIIFVVAIIRLLNRIKKGPLEPTTQP